MSLFKRGETWWVDIGLPGKKRVRETTGTRDRKEAQEFHDTLRSKLWRQAHLAESSAPAKLWDEAAVRWLRESQGKRDYSNDCKKLEWLDQFFAGKPLTAISGDLIYETVEGNKGNVSPATRNRYYALIRAIMRRAVKWKWIEPKDVPFVNMHREPEGRTRYLEREDFMRLKQELPEHLKPVVLFAVSTGLRMSNITTLRWTDVDLRRGAVVIPGSRTKNGKDLGIPLNAAALGVVKGEEGKHKDFVFTYRGKPIGMAGARAWRQALKRAGIENFRFHDLRHTWASWLIQSGASENMVQALGGWETAKMVKRYATLAVHHLAPTAALIDRIITPEMCLPVVSTQ